MIVIPHSSNTGMLLLHPSITQRHLQGIIFCFTTEAINARRNHSIGTGDLVLSHLQSLELVLLLEVCNGQLRLSLQHGFVILKLGELWRVLYVRFIWRRIFAHELRADRLRRDLDEFTAKLTA